MENNILEHDHTHWYPPLIRPYTFIVQFGWRHEDLFNPEKSCRPRMTWIFWVEQNRIEVLHTLAFHSKWVKLGAQNLYYDVTALVAAAHCRQTWQGDMTSGGRHEDLSSFHVTALDQLYTAPISLKLNFVGFNSLSIRYQLDSFS